MTIDHQSGIIRWTPSPDQAGSTYTPSVHVVDSDGRACATDEQFTIRVATKPTIVSSPIAQTTNGLTYEYPVVVEDADLNDTFTVTIINNPDPVYCGVVDGKVVWYTQKNVTPPQTYGLTVRVEDSFGLYDLQTFDLKVFDYQPPVLAEYAGSPYQIQEGNLFVLESSLAAPQPSLPGMTYSYYLVRFVEGMIIDASSGMISWTPGLENWQNWDDLVVEVTVVDTLNGTDTSQFTVSVDAENDSPEFDEDSVTQDVVECRTIDIRNRVEDPDDQDLQYYLMDGPSGLTIDREYGTIRWNPGEWWSQDGTSMVGSYQASIAVVDSAGNADIRSVIVNVAENSGEAVITGPTKIVLDENSSREIFVDVEYLTSSDQQNDFRAEVTSSGVVATIVKGEEWVGRFCNMNTLVIQVGSGLAGEFQIAVEVFMDESSIKTYTIPVIVVGGDAEMKFKYFYAYPPLLQGNVQENVKFGAVVDSSNRENNIIQLFEASSDGTILDLQTPICELVDIGSCDSNDEGDNNLCCTVPMNIQAGDRRYYRVRSHNQISGISTLSDGVVEVRATTHERQMEIPETENILIDPVDGVMMLGNVLQVEFAESASDFEMQTAAQSIGGLLSGATYFRNNWVISFPEVEDVGDLQALESSIRTNNPGIVESATPVFLIETAVQQFPCEEIKLDRRKQWYLDKLHMESVWMMARGGSRIAVLDSGVDLEHPALDGTIDSAECVDLTNTPYTANVTDYSGHGTNVSGIIAAEGNSDTNNTEFHGMSYGTRVVHFKTVTMKMGKYSSLTTLTQRALILAIAKDIRVVNISQALSTLLCADPKYQVTMQMFRDLSEILDAAGVTVVVSAGNDNTDGNHLYGCIGDNVIGVGGTGEDDNAWTVSINQGTNYGENVDIAAPAASIVTTRSFEENSGFWDNARDYECPGFCRVLGGTSLAAPMVAAAASMVDGFRGRTVEPSEMRRILMDSATRLSDKYAPGGIKPLGSGRLNILEALFHGGFEGARGRDNIGEFGITYTCYAHDDHEWVDCSFGIAPKVGVRFDQFEPKHGRGMLIMEMNTKGDIDIWTYLVVHKKFTILDGYDRMSISFWMNMITEDIAAIQNRPELGIQNHEVWLTIRAPSDEEHVYELIETCCDWPGEFGFESWKSGELDENDISFTDWRRLEYDYHLVGAGGEGSAVGSIAGEWDIELQVITRTNSALDESADRTIVLIDEIGVSGHEIGHP